MTCPDHALCEGITCPYCVIVRQNEQLREIAELNEELTRAINHGNGEVIRGWMQAHGKAMDKLEEAEEKIKELERKLAKADRDVQDLGNLSFKLRERLSLVPKLARR
jgi:uncharacterized protein YllA (UPF0747 family)